MQNCLVNFGILFWYIFFSSSPLYMFLYVQGRKFFLNPFSVKLTEEKPTNLFNISFTWPRSLHEEIKLSLETVATAAAKSLQSCLTVRPHRWQPTRLPRPWDSPGKNTGMGCHFQCTKVKSESEVAQSCPTLATPWTAAYQAPPSMGFSRQKYWSGVPLPSPVYFYAVCVFLCCLMKSESERVCHCQAPLHGILQARILEWVATSFSRDFPDPAIKLQSPVL